MFFVCKTNETGQYVNTAACYRDLFHILCSKIYHIGLRLKYNIRSLSVYYENSKE
jgi:hypothetical protein